MPRWFPFGVALALLAPACGYEFLPPAHPAHDRPEGGAMHAARLEHPFSCGDPSGSGRGDRGVDCPETRPSDDQLSCDATGCHGGFDFTPETRATRALIGSEGPSCYTCHGEKWNDD